MAGVALTKVITALNAGTVVIWMTAYGCNLSRSDAKRLGVYRCLDKPVEIGEIRQVVREALQAAEELSSIRRITAGVFRSIGHRLRSGRRFRGLFAIAEHILLDKRATCLVY